MVDYCLTTDVKFGKGTIAQVGVSPFQGCGGEGVGPDADLVICAAFYPEGLSGINLLAIPDIDNGWAVEAWEMTDHATGNTVDYWQAPSSPPGNSTNVYMTMPSFNVDVQVIFSHPGKQLTVTPIGNGCVELEIPDGIEYSSDCKEGEFTYILPPGIVEFRARPDNANYVISQWVDIDGVLDVTDSPTKTFSLPGADPSTPLFLEVYFELIPSCNINTLDITISGNGSVSPPSGSYCEDDILTLSPIPSYGHFFKGWEYDSLSGITENGIMLVVPMNINRSITAVFAALPDFETLEVNLFYCQSTTNRSNVVSFDFTNEGGDPSIYDNLHFRINFYSDPAKEKLLYSAFSLADNKRWFYNIDAYEPFPSGGVSLGEGDAVNIVYDPEVLPQQITETQMEKAVRSNVYENPLVCGVKYYVDIASYNSSTSIFSSIETMSLILDCDNVDSYYWNYNDNDDNWLCSGQGKVDLQVSSSASSQSVMSGVSSNIYGLYQIAWQTRRDGVYQVYGAMWDSETDVLYSSGQGRYDELKLFAGYDPIVLTDQANNFYIAGYTTEGTSPNDMTSDIYVNACPLPVAILETPSQTSTKLFAKLCSPGMDIYLSSSYNQIKARVYKEDVSGSLVVNNNKVVPIIKKKTIRLDIDGIAGAYAVRLRNSNDPDWSGWINIDNNLYYTGIGLSSTAEDDNIITAEDISYDAYRIDNSRFIVPWDVDRINGLKRVCCQVLTLYGITNVFCLDLFFNFDVPRHLFKFYSTMSTSVPPVFSNEFPTFNGRYILSLKNVNGEIQNVDSTVYFKVIFSEPIYANESTSPPISYQDGELTFNVVQQGIDDIWGGLLSVIDNKTFSGSFVISAEDGIFNKDGNSFIEIVFPELSTLSACLSNSSDLYNLMITDARAAEYKDLIPEEVYNRIQTNKDGRVFDLNQFKQYYDQDDSNFKFGNPGYFRE